MIITKLEWEVIKKQYGNTSVVSVANSKRSLENLIRLIYELKVKRELNLSQCVPIVIRDMTESY